MGFLDFLFSHFFVMERVMDKATFVVLASCLRRHHGIYPNQPDGTKEWEGYALEYLIKKDYGFVSYELLFDCAYHHGAFTPAEYYDKEYMKQCSGEGFMEQDDIFEMFMDNFPKDKSAQKEKAKARFARLSLNQMYQAVNESEVQNKLEWRDMEKLGDTHLIPGPHEWLVQKIDEEDNSVECQTN